MVRQLTAVAIERELLTWTRTFVRAAVRRGETLMLRTSLAAGLLVAALGAAASAEPARIDVQAAVPPAAPEAIRPDDQQLDRVAAGNWIINTAG
jgi:hypothetical protein